MVRSLIALALIGCLAAPVLAADDAKKEKKTTKTKVEKKTETKTETKTKAKAGGTTTTTRTRTTTTTRTLSAYPLYERGMGAGFYRSGYRLTPREYRRLRAEGFSRDEAFMIANAARVTALETSVFENAIYNGNYARQLSTMYGISPHDLTRVLPEWKTQAWADAVHESSPYSGDKLGVWW